MTRDVKWFDDIEPWLQTPEATPGRILAHHLIAVRVLPRSPALVPPSDTALSRTARTAAADRAPQEWETLFEPPKRTPAKAGRLSGVRETWRDHRVAVLGLATTVVLIALVGGLALTSSGGDAGPTESVLRRTRRDQSTTRSLPDLSTPADRRRRARSPRATMPAISDRVPASSKPSTMPTTSRALRIRHDS